MANATSSYKAVPQCLAIYTKFIQPFDSYTYCTFKQKLLHFIISWSRLPAYELESILAFLIAMYFQCP